MASDGDHASGSAQGGEKRKWQTGIMKVWLGTDPTTAAPEIQHRDPKAAVRAEQRKKRKVQPQMPRPKPTFRVIAPGKQGTAQSSAATSLSPVPTLNTKGLISLPAKDHLWGKEEADYTELGSASQGHASDITYGRVAANTVPFRSLRDSASITGDAVPLSSFPSSSTLHASRSQAAETQPGDWIMGDCEQPYGEEPLGYADHESVGIPVAHAASRHHEVATRSGANRLTELAQHSIVSSGSGNEVAKWLASAPASIPTSMLSDLKRIMGVGASTGDGFNIEWRRFGPKGRNISSYAPQFKDVPLVEWKSGLTTVSPFVPYEGPSLPANSASENSLQARAAGKLGPNANKIRWDQRYVETAASRLDDSRTRPDLCMHVKFSSEDEAADLIRECMAKGKPLVFDDFPASLRWAYSCDTVDEDPMMRPIAWSQHATKGTVGANLITPRDFQDAAVRELNMARPYVTATLLDFETWIRTPGKIGCILDLTCGFRQADDITDHIADNVVESMTNSFSNLYAGTYTIVGDMMKTQDWFLLHTSGFLTFGHIDASGMATSAQIRGGGLKKWMVFSSRNWPVATAASTRGELASMQGQLISMMRDLVHTAASRNLKPDVRKEGSESASTAEKQQPLASPAHNTVDMDGCVIELRPGMMYYQPAGLVHAVYTPVPTVAAGKHFFTFADLHRVETCRRVQMVEDKLTNHNHNCGVQLMLISMAAALPARAALGEVFRRKPMIALALMLTRPDEYIREEKLIKIAPPKARRKRKGETREDAEARFALEDQQRRDDAKDNAERKAECDMTARLRSRTWADDGTAFDRLAYTVARRILMNTTTSYGSPSDYNDEPGPEYIMEGSSWEDPGPILDVARFTKELLHTHIDSIRPTTYTRAESDLSDLSQSEQIVDIDNYAHNSQQRRRRDMKGTTEVPLVKVRFIRKPSH